MKIWIISDTHFGHQLMLDLGIRKAGYEKEMWDSMHNLVKEGDLLIHLGDVAFKPSTEVGQAMKLVKGNKILVRGNHDGGFDKYFDMGFNAVVDKFSLSYKRNIVFSHEPIAPSALCEDINIHGHLHGNKHRLQDDLIWYETYKPETGSGYPKFPWIDMAPEIWGNRVVSLDEVLKVYDRRNK